ncbi:MAG: glutamyl-tRNA reductase [Chloroflexota bacterium]|nr:glutamyl-tRNA reductase [Chloroflexota bacterium]MDE2683538.1 glutamyl-tRNA reductase [Chloroflexota bacterium]
MSLLVLGLDHRTAPVDLRERLSVEREQLPDALRQLSEYVPQSAILSTCNRTEVYVYDPDDIGLVGRVGDFMIGYSGVPGPELERHVYQLWETDCVAHLFRVAGGLESMIVGERQILGQVRAAFSAASRGGYTKSPLTRVFHSALRAGRRVHRETSIGQHSRSVSRAAVQLARGMFERLDDRRALVIGAGDAGRMVARALADAGVRQITVTNRTQWRAEELARDLGGVAVPFEDLPQALVQSDLVISSTGSPGYVVDAATVSEATARRPGMEPVLMIDIAVPRDIDPVVTDFDGVQLFDIDALGQVAEIDLDGLESEVRRAEDVVESEVGRFVEWWNSSDTMELAVAMRRRAEAVRKQEVARTLKLLGAGDDGELASRLDAMTNALVKKLLHQATAELRSADSATIFPAALRMFGDDPPGGRGRGRR